MTNIVNDMAEKRKKLLLQVSEAEIVQNVVQGFNYMQKLKQIAYERMEELRKH